MAIRTITNPRYLDLQPELQQILHRNGLQAHIISSPNGFQLAVQGHDSPLLNYPLSQKQVLALTDWGTLSANKKAYNVLTSLLGSDFYMPKDFVHARNANGRVAMGLHGYRIGVGEYGRVSPFLGWSPRNQDGYHLRRIGGQLFYPQSPMVAERPDRRLKPGELQSGGYGFYYKGGSQVGNAQKTYNANEIDVLKDLQAVITPIHTAPRSTEPAKAYSELISSPVYFSNEKWQECLDSHGIIIDTERRTLTIQSEKLNADMVYDLNDNELEALTHYSVQEHSIERRLQTINTIIKDDFADAVTLESLESNARIALALHPQLDTDLNQRIALEEELNQPKEKEQTQQIKPEPKESIGKVYVSADEREGKYRMTAVFGGESISREISQRDYDKFLAVDDRHKMKLFERVFGEAEQRNRSNVGTKIFAALAAGTVVLRDLLHGRPMPDLYCEHFAAPRTYFKPGVDSPQDIAARQFEAMANSVANEMRHGR